MDTEELAGGSVTDFAGEPVADGMGIEGMLRVVTEAAALAVGATWVVAATMREITAEAYIKLRTDPRTPRQPVQSVQLVLIADQHP